MICMKFKGFSEKLTFLWIKEKSTRLEKTPHGPKDGSSWAAHHNTWAGSVVLGWGRTGPLRGPPSTRQGAARAFDPLARQRDSGGVEGQRRGGSGTWRGDGKLGSPGSEAAGSMSPGSGQNEVWRRRHTVEENRQRGCIHVYMYTLRERFR